LSHNEIASPTFDVTYSTLTLLRHVDLGHNDFRRLRAADLAPLRSGTIRYDTRCYFNVRSKADISQLNLPHGTDN